MRVRIIAGRFGGRFLQAPSGKVTHPMGERVRSALFNSIGGNIENAKVLDVFAGSGAVGLEALSRGASDVTFVERDRTALKILNENIKELDVEDDTIVIKTTVSNWLETTNTDEFDFIFADPPYYNPQFSTVKRLFGLLKPGGCMILSHTGSSEVPTKNGIVVVDNRSYGNAHLTVFRREE